MQNKIFKPSIEDLKKCFLEKKYRLYTKNMSINLFGIRNNSEEYDNVFSDTLGILYVDSNRGWQQVQIPGTTKPGLWGGQAVMNPRPGGVAVLVPGQYLRVWRWMDTYTQFTKYPFMRQIGDFNLYRDGNKDKKLDKVNMETVGEGTGINMHIMSIIGKKNNVVNNWSEGCQGSPEPYYRKFLPVIRKSVKIYGDTFSYTLFSKEDFYA